MFIRGCNFFSADFFQLLFVSLQWSVFNIEKSTRSTDEYGGGSNKDIKANEQKLPSDNFVDEKEYVEWCRKIYSHEPCVYWVLIVASMS